MSAETYEKIAVLLRYPLAAAGVFIAIRALYMTFKDGQKAAKLRHGESVYGAVALLHIQNESKRGETQKIPIGRNGCVGGGMGADVRVKGMGLKGRHFEYEIRASKMYVSAIGYALIEPYNPKQEIKDKGTIVLANGERMRAGKAVIRFTMLRLPTGGASPMNAKVYRPKGMNK